MPPTIKYTLSTIVLVALIAPPYLVFFIEPPCQGPYKFEYSTSKLLRLDMESMFECFDDQGTDSEPICSESTTAEKTEDEDYLSRFHPTRNFAIGGHNTVKVGFKVTEEECAKICYSIVTPKFECKSFDYIKGQQFCDLAGVTARDDGVKFYQNTGVDHYEKRE